ncbi:DUF1272 domain-containing protein [Paraglaciecola sp.]|uniref:DUF1272 domain-containing protein n=1 Tax=Paraglaciecola sp. TaxID=1920173 RepID=UPI003EF782ED
MLQIRPNCEICDADLAADSTDALICSYECTYCKNCVEKLLGNSCPNCGGDLCQRPIRPLKEYRAGVSLLLQPASKQRVHSKYNPAEIVAFCASLQHIPPYKR